MREAGTDELIPALHLLKPTATVVAQNKTNLLQLLNRLSPIVRTWFRKRATTSLARLLAKQGKRDEARTMLAEIYNWFTEGFDLKDAKALLDEVNA